MMMRISTAASSLFVQGSKLFCSMEAACSNSVFSLELGIEGGALVGLFGSDRWLHDETVVTLFCLQTNTYWMITGAPYDVRDLVERLLLHVLGRLVLAFQNSHRNQLERDILLVQHTVTTL